MHGAGLRGYVRLLEAQRPEPQTALSTGEPQAEPRRSQEQEPATLVALGLG